MDRIECRWCRGQNPPATPTCLICGAPVDSRNLVSESGWREAPRLREMTEFRFSNSTCQVEGTLVPVIEVDLADGDGVYFEHHVLNWKESRTRLGALALVGAGKRTVGGMPHLVTMAEGPGRVAFSRRSAGELVVLPLGSEVELDVREHAFLLASNNVEYSYTRVKGLANILHGGSGMYIDRFVAGGAPGLVVLHGSGNVLERDLEPDEKIMIEPGGLLYKDSSVQMNAVQIKMKTGAISHRNFYLAEMAGPGRVGIQSMYVHHRTA